MVDGEGKKEEPGCQQGHWCVSSTCDTEGSWASMLFGMLIATIDSYLSPLPVIREMATFCIEEPAWQVPKEYIGFCLTTRIWGSGVSSGPDNI